MPNKIKINDPDRPGRIIPVIPIIPQIKTKNKLSFSFDGEMKVNNTAINIPIIKETILELSHFLILLPTKNIEIKIRPKKKAHINKGKLLNKYLNRDVSKYKIFFKIKKIFENNIINLQQCS